MRNVVAIFSDEKNIPLKITSNQALYNNSNYNSNFSENVKVEYLDNVVLSDKLDINFGENIIKIYENVVYEGLQGTIKADNVVLNLITKNMKIFMQTKGEKVEVLSK
jgi:lipopolysaccharide export system protein LptA